MDTEGDVTVVFLEPAMSVAVDQKLMPQEDAYMARGSDILRAILHALKGDKQKDVLEELKKNGAAVKLQELIDYFSAFSVESVDLNVAATVGGGILVLRAEGTAGITITVKPKPKQ